MIIIDQVSCSQKNSHRETISSSQCLAFWQSSSFVAITVKLHRRISLTILQRCSLLKNMIRRETEAILAILLWLSCWCSFSAASKPKLSAVAFIIGCRREATPKHRTGPAAVAFSIECRRGATPKHKTDPAEGARNVWNFCQFYRILVTFLRPQMRTRCASGSLELFARLAQNRSVVLMSCNHRKSITVFIPFTSSTISRCG